MTQNEYLKKLAEALKNNGINQVEEILADYQEHFAMGLRSGKTEWEISQKLGEPETIAKAYQTESLIREIKNPDTKFSFPAALNVLGRLIILAPFNFLVIFIPGMILFSLLVAGWTIAAAFLVCSIALVVWAISASLLSISFWISVALSSGSLSLLGFAALIGFVMFFLSKQFILASISYLQWNLKIILQK